MIVSFYSYKGGVGRSMALAQVARIYAAAGLRVLCIDGDLEAPGLERHLDPTGKWTDPSHIGLVDLLAEFSYAYRSGSDLAAAGFRNLDRDSTPTVMSELLGIDYRQDPFDSYIQDLTGNTSGSIHLLSAGSRRDFIGYSHKLRDFSWEQSGGSRMREAFYAWFRKAVNQFADVVLFDSRTGFSDQFGISTKAIADQVVIFCAPNQQNIEGTSAVVDDLATSYREPWWPKSPIPVHVVPSRIDLSTTGKALDRLNDIFADLRSIGCGQSFDSASSEMLTSGKGNSFTSNTEVIHFDGIIPYDREYANSEIAIAGLLIEESNESADPRTLSRYHRYKDTSLATAYANLASAIADAACPNLVSDLGLDQIPAPAEDSPDVQVSAEDSNGETHYSENKPARETGVVVISAPAKHTALSLGLGIYLSGSGHTTVWDSITAGASFPDLQYRNIFELTYKMFERAEKVLAIESESDYRLHRWSLALWYRVASSRPGRKRSNQFDYLIVDYPLNEPLPPTGLSSIPGDAVLKQWFVEILSRLAPAKRNDAITNMNFGNLVDLTDRDFKRLGDPNNEEELNSVYRSRLSLLDWENTTGSARKWWEAFEAENKHRLVLCLNLVEELRKRKATITEFFLAYVYSNTDNIQANLAYLDYTRLKKIEERKRREAEAAKAASVESTEVGDLTT